MTLAMGESIGISKQRGFWLRCFLSITILPSLCFATLSTTPVFAQTVCIGGATDCEKLQTRLCNEEPAPANLFVAHSVHLMGAFFDPTGAPIDFDSIKPDHQTIVQIRNPKSGVILFAVPLRSNGQFEFELVPEGSYRLILAWMKDGKFERLPLADQPGDLRCSDSNECRIISKITFHGSDNPIDFCPPK